MIGVLVSGTGTNLQALLDAELPVTALVDQFYAEVEKIGGKRWDTSSLIALLQR